MPRSVTLQRIYTHSGLTHSQIQIWTGQTIQTQSPLYNMAFAIILDGTIEPDLFQQAWQKVVDQSDALRSFVEIVEGMPVRRIRALGSCPTRSLDFSDHADAEDRFKDWARERCARPLSMEGELVDSVLVKLSPQRFGWYLNQHHLVTDATSTIHLYRRVASAYENLRTQGSVPPAGAGSYYATAQTTRDSIDEPSRQYAESHWKNRLNQDRSIIDFYGRKGQPETTRSERLDLVLDAATSDRLRAIAGEDGFLSFTPDISLFAVFSTLLTSWLHLLSGKSDLGFDAPAQNRPTGAARDSLGLFIEVFPFHVTIDPEDTFRTMGGKCLAETQLLLRSALPESSSPTGATAGNVVLNFFTLAFGDFAGLSTHAEWIHSGHSDGVHAVRLQVHDYNGTGCYHLSFDLNLDVFPDELRLRAVQHFERLLQVFIKNPDRRVAAVDLLTDDERNFVIEKFNAPSGQDLPEAGVTRLFRSQAETCPDRIALRELDRTMSFRELDQASSKVAAGLLEQGAESDLPIALFMRRSIDVVTAILGVLKAGRAYIPIDPSYPESRVHHILEDSGAEIVLTLGTLAPGTLGDRSRIVRLEDLSTHEPRSLPEPSLTDLAYIIYTSGSTGRPKGVEIEHGGLADYITWAARQYVRDDHLSFPLFTSLSFDLTVTSLFLPLITGGTLVIYPEPSGPVDTALMDVVDENAVDFIKLTPSHLSLLRQMDVGQSRISRMVVGGEDFKTELAAAIDALFTGKVEIYNEYGPTEAVVGCMIHRFDPQTDTGPRVPIGYPADHVRLHVLNSLLVPVPEGVPGELCISRYGLARGYRNQPDLTAERFVPDPAEQDERLYRTGDLVRFVRPGVLEYLGRIDRQLKLSGYRVEPAEIESALLTHDAVEACVIKAIHHASSKRDDAEEADSCVRCGLPSNYPNTVIDEEGVCSICRSFDTVKDFAQDYFRTEDDLKAIFAESARNNSSKYDCMMLLSGGKDSTYALCRLVDLGLKVYAFSLDNGFISEQAKENIRQVVEALGVDYEFGSTPAMNAIFRDSLMRFSNVCQGCFKTIYTLSVNRARELGIPIIVTGLSRGQFFETRLTENLFRGGRCDPEEVDAAVLAARKIYHRIDDEVGRTLDVSAFQDERIFDQIRFVDFYRYVDVPVGELLTTLKDRVPWVRPSDTGRSTNCLINDVGIYIHKKERGYHNYALPYSWDVRMGHKTREGALEELDDSFDMDSIRSMLDEIGYDEDRLASRDKRLSVTTYYVSSRDIPETEFRRHLAESLPAALIPNFFRRIDAIPLTPNGKVDLDALPETIEPETAHHEAWVAPEGPVQERLAEIWQESLGVERIGARDSFFALGGTSLAGMDVMLQICNEFEVDLPLQTVFQHPSVEELADILEQTILREIDSMTDDEARQKVDLDDRN